MIILNRQKLHYFENGIAEAWGTGGINLSFWDAERLVFCYRETHECIKNWFVKPL